MPNPRTQAGRGQKQPADTKTTDAVAKRGAKTGAGVEDRKWSGYCIKEKSKMEMANPRKDKFKNGTKVIVGECVGCGNKLTMIVKGEVWDAFTG